MQEEIINLLEKERMPLFAHEIAKKLKEDPKKIMKKLKQLIKYKEIQYIEVDRILARRFNNYIRRRRMRVYFIE